MNKDSWKFENPPFCTSFSPGEIGVYQFKSSLTLKDISLSYEQLRINLRNSGRVRLKTVSYD